MSTTEERIRMEWCQLELGRGLWRKPGVWGEDKRREKRGRRRHSDCQRKETDPSSHMLFVPALVGRVRAWN